MSVAAAHRRLPDRLYKNLVAQAVAGAPDRSVCRVRFLCLAIFALGVSLVILFL